MLAETGAPFAWTPETSGPYSYIGLYFGIHEALKTLKRRGVVLAAVSKNDEAVVRQLWTYPDHYPRERLLTPDDFVTWRVNWDSKAENIRAIAEELGFALDAFLFIDDHPVERERIRQQAPEVEVWGEELFSLRRRLLSDPRLQPPRVTGEAAGRTALVKAQLGRARLRAAAPDEDVFLGSLDIRCVIGRLGPGAPIERVRELFQRTTQFNTTGRKFSVAELSASPPGGAAAVFTLKVSDRFADHGLVGAAVIERGEIVALAISCRVMGLGVEHRFLEAILVELAPSHDVLAARIRRDIPQSAGAQPLSRPRFPPAAGRLLDARARCAAQGFGRRGVRGDSGRALAARRRAGPTSRRPSPRQSRRFEQDGRKCARL